MRVWHTALVVSLSVLALSSGCAPAPSTGGLWSQTHLQRELAVFRLTDAQRADGAREYELGLADARLAVERARLEQQSASCAGSSEPRPRAQPVQLSPGDRARDGIRIQAQGDPERLAGVAQLALADWQLRRAAVSGDARFCEAARATLLGQAPRPAAEQVAQDPFATAVLTSVQRDPDHPGVVLDGAPPELALSSYVLGAADGVRAASPLPEYLAAVYGGTLSSTLPNPAANDQPIEALVDALAPAHPEWEPDALYAALEAR